MQCTLAFTWLRRPGSLLWSSWSHLVGSESCFEAIIAYVSTFVLDLFRQGPNLIVENAFCSGELDVC